VGNADSLDIKSLYSVAGKNVLITGGATGIGLMFTEAFVKNGANVYISSRNAKQCQEVATKLTSKGPGKCHAIPLDLASVEACEKLVSEIKSLGVSKLHILINNSGVSWGQSLEEFVEKGWDRVMNLNVKSVFFLTKAALPLLENAATQEDPSRVINIGSIAGIRHQIVPTYSYDVSKSAVHALTRKLANDLASRHITVNAIAPGLVPSKMSNQLTKYASKEALVSGIPLGRAGTPEDMAGVAIFLSSRAGAWVTGAIIPVDGGSVNNVSQPMGTSSL